MASPKDVSFTIKAVDAASSTFKKIKGELSDLRKRFFDLGGALTAAAAGFTLGAILKSAIKEAAEAESGMLRLGKAVENVGGNFAAMRPDIDETISRLTKLTTFQDDELVAGLETLTLVSGDAKGSVNALGLAADIAKAKKMGLAEAATLVGKVMVGETSMLKRQGIVLREGADAMAELQARFGGFAATEAKTLSGALVRIGNAWGEVAEALGRAMMGGEKTGGILGMVADRLATLEQWITANEAEIADFTNALATVAGILVDVVGGAVRYTIIGLKTLSLGIDTVGALLANLGLAGKVGLGELMQLMGEWLESSAGFFDKLGISVDELGGKLANLGSKWKNAGLAAQRENRSALWGAWGSLGDYVNGTPSGGAGASPAPRAPRGLPGTGVSAAEAKALDALRQSLSELLATSAQGATKAEAFAQKIAKWTAEAEKSRMSAKEQAKALAELGRVLDTIKADEAADAFRDLDAALMEATGDVVQKATVELGRKMDALKDKARNVTNPAEVAKYNAQLAKLDGLYKGQIRALSEVEASKQRLKALDEWMITHPPFSMSQEDLDKWGAALEAEIKRLETALASPELTAGAKALLEDQLKAARGEMDKWGDAVATHIEQVADKWRQAADAAQDYRERVAAAMETTAALARGIIAAAGALDAFDAKTQAIANDVANLADSVGKLLKSGGKDVGAWVQAIGSIADLGAKLFEGETKQEKAQRLKVFSENTAAIARLTEKIGLLGTNLSGASATRAYGMLFGSLSSYLNQINLSGASDKAKVSGIAPADWRFLQDVAKSLGITLDGTAGSLRQLGDALRTATGHLASFDSSYAGQRSFAEQFNRLFGETGANALERLVAPAKAFSPAVSGLFQGIDINSPEGQAELRRRAQELFLRMSPTSSNPLSALELGGLTGSDLAQVIQDIIDALNGIGDAAPAIAEHVATAAEQLADSLRSIDNEAEILGTSSADVLRAKVAAYAKVFPEIGKVLDGLDLSNAGDLDKLRERLRDLFRDVRDGTLTLPDGTAFDDIVQAILALLGAGDKVASGIESAAARMNHAADSLRTDFEVFGTTGGDQARQLGDLYGFNIGDVSTQEGRDAAIAGLQDLYRANKDDKDKVAQILEVLRVLRALPEIPGAAGDAGALEPVAVKDAPVTGGLASASYAQIDNLSSIAKLTSDYVRAIRDFLLDGSVAAYSGPVTLPIGDLSSIAALTGDYIRDIRDFLLGGNVGGDSGPVSVSVGAIYVDARGTSDPSAVESSARRGVDAGLAGIRLNLRAAAGAPRA